MQLSVPVSCVHKKVARRHDILSWLTCLRTLKCVPCHFAHRNIFNPFSRRGQSHSIFCRGLGDNILKQCLKCLMSKPLNTLNSTIEFRLQTKTRKKEEPIEEISTSGSDKHAEFHVFVFNSHLLTCHNSDNNIGLEEVKRRVAGNNSLS